jgi:hypothetical protein
MPDYSFYGYQNDSSGSVSFNLSSLYDPLKYTAELLSARVSLAAHDDESWEEGNIKTWVDYTDYWTEESFWPVSVTKVRSVTNEYSNPNESLLLNYNGQNFGFLAGSYYYFGKKYENRYFDYYEVSLIAPFYREYYTDVYNQHSGYILEGGFRDFHIARNLWDSYDPSDPFVINYNVYGDMYIPSFRLLGELELTEIPQNNAVPEPATLFLFVSGLFGILSQRYRLETIEKKTAFLIKSITNI